MSSSRRIGTDSRGRAFTGRLFRKVIPLEFGRLSCHGVLTEHVDGQRSGRKTPKNSIVQSTRAGRSFFNGTRTRPTRILRAVYPAAVGRGVLTVDTIDGI